MSHRPSSPFVRVSGLAGLLLAVGCGARSGMLSDRTDDLPGEPGVPTVPGADAGLDAHGSGGTGGTAGTGGTGGTGGTAGMGGAGGQGAMGGAGGSAGMTVCPSLGLVGSPVGFEPTPYYHRTTPLLAHASQDGQQVAVVSPTLAVESPGPVAATLTLSAFSPWLPSWPGSLGPGATSAFVVGVDQVALDRGATDGTLGIAYPATPAPPATEPDGLFFGPEVGVSSGSAPFVASLALEGLESHVARFVRRGEPGHLVGFESESFGIFGFHLSHLPGPNDSGASTLTWQGCATTPMSGDAIAMPGGGFMFALSTSRPWGTCLNDDGYDGPAHRIVTGFLAGPGGGFGPLAFTVDDPTDQVKFVRMLAHPQGAWVAWQYEGLTAESPPPVMLARVDQSGNLLLPPTPILDGWVPGAQPAFASLGDRLVVAWLDTADPFGGTIMIRVLGPEGGLLHESVLQPGGPWIDPHLEALASPSADQMLVAWSDGGDADSPRQAWVARLCVPK